LNIWGSRTGIIFVNYSEAPYELRAGNKFISLDEIINDTVEGTMTGVVIELKEWIDKNMKYLKLFENFTGKISENLQYHIDIKPVVENIFRPGSNQYFNLIS
jgi:hypothetical protein